MIGMHDDATIVSRFLCILHGSVRQPTVVEAAVRFRFRVLLLSLCTLKPALKSTSHADKMHKWQHFAPERIRMKQSPSLWLLFLKTSTPFTVTLETNGWLYAPVLYRYPTHHGLHNDSHVCSRSIFSGLVLRINDSNTLSWVSCML